MKTRTLVTSTLVGAALLAGLVWAFAPRPLPVDSAKASLGRFEQAIEEDGRTRLLARHVLAAPLAGRLARISLREGDAVAAGAEVARLSPVLSPLLDARSRAELSARRDAARAGVKRAAAMAAQQQLLLDQAGRDLARNEPLARQGFIAQARLDGDRLAVMAARRGLDVAQQGQRMAEHELQMAQAALQLLQAGSSEALGADFILRSPVAGQVLRVLQPSATTVALGTPLLEIGDISRLEVVAELLTTDAMALPPGALVQIQRWGGAGGLTGRVQRVEPAAFTKVSALGVEEQRVKVLISLDEAPAAAGPALGDGYRVGLRILTRVQDQALLVPVSAVFPMPGQPGAMAVFAIAQGLARLTPVTLAGRNGHSAWVSQGLAEGDQVIAYPPAALTDGARVKPRSSP